MPKGRTPPDWVYRYNIVMVYVSAWGTGEALRDRMHLLNTSDMSRDIFDRDRVLDCQTMTLAFYPCFVDQHSAVGRETYPYKYQ
jgi:hypothetical protein